MKNTSLSPESTKTTSPTPTPQPSTGSKGIAVAPPAYGIESVDHAFTSTGTAPEPASPGAPVQMKADVSPASDEDGSGSALQQNRTGLPDALKIGVESLSGLSLDDVRVHYNSSRPAQLQALAYTQGSEIHVGPGQERHLPHEAWHVVQQKQGRVQKTMQAKGGILINDNKELENEADVMGNKAIQIKDAKSLTLSPSHSSVKTAAQFKPAPVIQRRINWGPLTQERIYNLADPVFNESDFGTTPAFINTVEVDRNNAATIIPAPTFAFNSSTNSLSVTAEPNINIHCHMKLPTTPPWQRMDTVTNTRSYLGTDWPTIEDPQPADNDALRVNARGLPNDAEFVNVVKTHETHHVNETRDVARQIFTPWDTNIREIVRTGRTFIGTDETDAKNNFYAAAGGTPSEIGQNFFDGIYNAGNAYHQTAEGRSPSFNRTRTRFTAGTPHVLDVYWQHPAELLRAHGSDCFITTACIQAKSLPDDCLELTTLRAFRDQYIVPMEKGKEMLKVYYENAPLIVDAINQRKDALEIYRGLYVVIHQCVEAIQAEKYESAFQTYVDMVIKLRNQFAPMATIPTFFFKQFRR